MRLTRENAQLYRAVPGAVGGNAGGEARLEKCDFVEDANAIMFDCPVPGHGHAVLVYFAPHGRAGPVPPDWRPKPRWQVSGRDVTDITISPSINLDVVTRVCGNDDCRRDLDGAPACPNHPTAGFKELPPGCRWHGWVQNGNAQ